MALLDRILGFKCVGCASRIRGEKFHLGNGQWMCAPCKTKRDAAQKRQEEEALHREAERKQREEDERKRLQAEQERLEKEKCEKDAAMKALAGEAHKLKTGTYTERRSAIDRLEQSGDPNAIAPLEAALREDDDLSIRQRAQEAIDRLQRRNCGATSSSAPPPASRSPTSLIDEINRRREKVTETKPKQTMGGPTAPARALSRQLNDAAISAVRSGDYQTAQKRWVEAAIADPTFSGPPFNMARFMLDKGARGADALCVVEKYLDAAQRNAWNGTENEDLKILEQLPTLRQWLEQRKKTVSI